jgi:hypothetical protein
MKNDGSKKGKALFDFHLLLRRIKIRSGLMQIN